MVHIPVSKRERERALLLVLEREHYCWHLWPALVCIYMRHGVLARVSSWPGVCVSECVLVYVAW